LKAAMSIIEHVGRMFESGRMFRSFWVRSPLPYHGRAGPVITPQIRN
jgi:hypothetical protein